MKDVPMGATAAPVWLGRVYVVALLLHAVLVAGIVALALLQTLSLGFTANAAREGLGLSLIIFVTILVPAIPSIFALLSWWLCRRNGWRPSKGHMGLTIAVPVAILILFTVSNYL
jgi:hypothetical protein